MFIVVNTCFAVRTTKRSSFPPDFFVLPRRRTLAGYVKIVRQLASALLLVVLLGYPAMACLVLGAERTQAERNCCKQMAEQCGSMKMPSSHSCCQSRVGLPNSMLHASFVQLTGPMMSGAVASELPRPDLAAPGFSSFEFHPPPESPPGTSSILRI